MTDPLLVEWASQDVLTLTLNRPERRNALSPDLLEALAAALADEGQRARAVILRGAGEEAFSAGYDLGHLTGSLEDLEADRRIGAAVDALRSCPAPVIAVLHGHCYGAAVEIATSCDLRLASPTLRMAVPAVSLGVVYRYEFIARLVDVCGLNRASDILLGMREIDAATALAWGLVSEVRPASEIDARAREVATKLASAPQAAVRGTKASLNLLNARRIAAEDAAAAQRLRVEAASSQERQDALKRRRERK